MRVLDLFFASRPLLQIPIWTVYLISLHYHNQLSGGRFERIDLLIMVSISLIFSSAAYLNQVYDFESDRLNKKVGFLQEGFLTQRQLIAGFLILIILPLAITPFISRITFFLFAQFIVLAYIYSAPPISLKDRPISGLFANAYAHGVLVSLSVMPEMNIHNTGLLGWDNPIYFFLAVGSTHILTTVPDMEGDMITGKKTLAVVLGRRGAIFLSALFVAASAWVAYYSGFLVLSLISVVAFILTTTSLLFKQEQMVLVAVKLPIFLLTLLACFFFPTYTLFIVALIFSCRIYYKKRFGIKYP